MGRSASRANARDPRSRPRATPPGHRIDRATGRLRGQPPNPHAHPYWRRARLEDNAGMPDGTAIFYAGSIWSFMGYGRRPSRWLLRGYDDGPREVGATFCRVLVTPTGAYVAVLDAPTTLEG